ncbi:MAG TPA: hypothetical protein VGK10_00545 [Prolixibacteraceae bacterium]
MVWLALLIVNVGLLDLVPALLPSSTFVPVAVIVKVPEKGEVVFEVTTVNVTDRTPFGASVKEEGEKAELCILPGKPLELITTLILPAGFDADTLKVNVAEPPVP